MNNKIYCIIIQLIIYKGFIILNNTLLIYKGLKLKFAKPAVSIIY